MRYPLEQWKTLKRGYKFGVPTSYNANHLGTDVICPVGTKVYSPCDGYATSLIGTEGGITIHLKTPENLIRFLHLSKILKTGYVKEGDIIALTGNTGSVTTGPHLHTDISKGPLQLSNFKNFIDPEIFYKSMFKLCLINLDVTDPELVKLPDALKKEVARLSGGLFPIETTIVNMPKTDALQNLEESNGAYGLKYDYIKACVDQSNVTGFQTVGVIYHWDGKTPAVNIRPRAHWGPHKGMQMIESWFWNNADVPDYSSMVSGWVWAVIHELCHSIFFRLQSIGIQEADTTHNNNPGEFSDEFKIFNKYITQLTGGVTPPEPMLDFRKGDKKDNIYVIGKDGKWHPFLEPEIYGTFAPFGKVTIIPQAQMDALPKGLGVGYVLAD